MTDTATETEAGAAGADGATDPAATTAAAGEQGEGAQQPAETPPPPKDSTRRYGVFEELELDMTKPAEEIVALLQQRQLPDQAKLTVLVRIGRAQQTEPRKAIDAVGQARDLDGDYQVIADSSRTTYKNVKSKTERTVTIG